MPKRKEPIDLFIEAWDKQEKEEMATGRKRLQLPRVRFKPVVPPQYRTLKNVILKLKGYEDQASVAEVLPALQFLLDSGWSIRACASCRRPAFAYKATEVVLCGACQNLERKVSKKNYEESERRRIRRLTKLVARENLPYIVVGELTKVEPVSAENV